MALDAHLAELKKKHSEIEAQIEEALTHLSVDDTELQELKRRKLKLKDTITQLSESATAH